MSLATSIKNFADILTDISIVKGFTGDFPKTLLLQQLFLYTFQSLIAFLIYLFSFQWLRDLSYLPLLAPQINPTSLFVDNWFENPASHIFSLSSLPKQATDQLSAGFINSFFFSLPFSLPHLISLRRLFSQGPAAAAASVLGIIAANSLLIMGVIFGLRFLIIPSFSLEPLNYIIGVLVIAFIIKEMANQKGFKLVPLRDKRSLIKMGILTFLLTWCEETNIFHSLSHLTLNAQTTYLDLYPSYTPLNSFIVHTTYLLAFFLGHCLFTALFYYLLFMGSRYISSFRWFTTAMITLRLSKVMLFLIVAFTLSSFPYYGLDYLVTNIAGFLPEDPVYSNTFLSPTAVKTKYPHFFKEIPPAQREQKTPLHLDLNYFDRGLYLNAPIQQKNTVESNTNEIGIDSNDTVLSALQNSKGQDNSSNQDSVTPLSFEELNYQGEYAWIMRNQLSKDLSKMRPSVFTPMFKKPRRRYLQLRKLTDKRMEQAARAAHYRTPLGGLAESQEGILPGEKAPLFIKLTDFLGRSFDSSETIAKPTFLATEKESQQQDHGKKSHSNLEKTSGSDRIGLTELDESQFFKSKNELESKADSSSKKLIQSLSFEKNKNKNPIKEELLFERQIQKTYSKGFSSPFSLQHERMRFRYLPVKNVIKKRYFLNNVYKSLLKTDIDSFLARQPKAHKLAQNQEFQLFQKRKMLQNYYNWLRYYEPFDKMMNLRFQIPDTKSFVDNVYHQQFKGTLKIVRRLFKVTFDSNQNPDQSRVLSYDQMLYNNLQQNENPLFHEELFHQKTVIPNKFKQRNSTDSNSIQTKQEVNSYENEKGKDFQDTYLGRTPFIEESNSSPIYAGWDPILRRFVVTNRFVIKEAE